MSRWDPADDEIHNRQPYTYGEAKAAIARASRDQTEASDYLRETFSRYATTERLYRIELAKEILRLKAAGQPATLALDLAKGDAKIADLRQDRDIAEGEKEAATQRGWQASANRRAMEQLVNWSMKRDLAEFYDGGSE